MKGCCVKGCKSGYGCGISFHSFPEDLVRKQLWISAVQTSPNWTPTIHCCVCSEHFEDDDFELSDTGGWILLEHAVPSKNLSNSEKKCEDGFNRRVVILIDSTEPESFETEPESLETKPALIETEPESFDSEPELLDTEPVFFETAPESFETELESFEAEPESLDTEHLQVCRLCLVTDVKLYNIHDSKMSDAVCQVTACVVTPTDGLPQYICCICWALILKCSKFRVRCDNAQDVLEKLRSKGTLTTDLIRTVDRKLNNLVTPLKQENTDIMSNLDDVNLNVDENYTILDDVYLNDENYNILNNNQDDKSDEEIVFEVLDDNQNDTSDVDMIEIQNIKRKYEESRQSEEILESEIKPKKVKKSDGVKKRKPIRRKYMERFDCKDKLTEEDYFKIAKDYNVDVVFLTLEEQKREVQSRKESENYKKNKYKCDVCFWGFKTEYTFKNHMAHKHHPSVGKYVCESCGFRFAKRYKLLNHLRHHKINYVCKLCDNISNSRTQAKAHFNWHKGTNYPCRFCPMSFNRQTTLSNHIRTSHGSTCCNLCQEVFAGELGLRTHLHRMHRQAVKLRCKSCGVLFLNEDSLNRHLEISPEGICQPGTRACAQCGDIFNTEDELKEHSRANHWKEIRCETCNETLENEKAYKIHSLKHKPIKEYHPYNGTRSAARQVYTKMCEICGFICDNPSTFRFHQMIHTGEKPHLCPFCPKRFRLPTSYKQHLNIHTGDRPYKCPHCPKAFGNKSQYYAHQLVHTQIRRFRCHLCDEKFLTKYCVKTHIKSVHMNIPLRPRGRNRKRPDQ